MKLWLIPMLALLALSRLSNAGQEEDNVLSLDSCPEHCECVRGTGEGTVVNCYRITPTQRFQESIASFNLLRNAEHSFPPLKLTRKFFRDLGMVNVESITITMDIASIDRNAFEGLRSLTYVNLTGNNLTTLHPDTFASNTFLRILSLSKNPISFLRNDQNTSDTLMNIPDLNELDISFCQLNHLTPNAFKNLPDLAYINLASNYLVDIDEKVFQNLKNLEELDLSDNNIRTLSPDTFSNIENLYTLRLNNNPLASIENIVFPGLTTLDLAFCKFTQLNSASFRSLTDVLHLNLSGNGLTELNKDVFANMKQLLNLDLSSNNLGPLDEMVFYENDLLETLSLRDNPQMRLWPQGGFKGQFNNLYRLNLYNTGIQTLGASAFKSMSYLAQLDLGRNFVKIIEAGVLPHRIKYLSLENNNITSVGDVNFPKEFQVRHLFLAGNQLKSLNQSHFSNLPSLSRLELSSCSLETVWSGSNSKSPYFKNVRNLNLSKNKLHKILPDDLKVFSSLEMLDIRYNPLICNDDMQNLLSFLSDSTIVPISQTNKGNIDENWDLFLWEDIATNCSHQVNGKNNVGDFTKPLAQPTSLPKSVKISASPSNELDSEIYDEDYDEYEENYPKSKSEYSKVLSDNGYNYKPDDVHNQIRFNPAVVEVQVSGTSPFVIVFLSALGMTFVLTLLLALISMLCKRKDSPLFEAQKERRRCGGSSSYQQLHNNEHPNSPTTPIVKTKFTSFPSHAPGASGNPGVDEYNQREGQVTYLNNPFHANISPERV